MKRGRRRAESEGTGSAIPVDGVAGGTTMAGEDTGTVIPATDAAMVGLSAVNGVQALQVVTLGIALACLVWLVFHTILHVI
jgi:hypothetical protein